MSLSPPLHIPPPLLYMAQVSYLNMVKSQASRITTGQTRGVLEWKEEGSWLDSVDVIAFVDKLQAKANAMVAALPRAVQSLQAPLSPQASQAARMVHDALLVCTMYGYFPPPRWAQCN